MANIYIPFGTVEGQTARIAEYIADVVRGQGHEARAADLRASGNALPAGCEGVILGGSVHVGKHEGCVTDFVRANRAALNRLPTAFFSVSLAAHGDEGNAEGYVEKFMDDAGWRPSHVALFGGALPYTQYGFLKRHLMRTIAGSKGSPDTDLTRDYYYTEWDGVRRFAEDFVSALPAPSD